MFHNTKNKNKKWFCKNCLQCFSSENVLTKHRADCLSINGKESVKIEKGINEFKSYLKKIPAPFKFFVDFKCNLKSVESYEGSYTKKYQDHVSCSFAYKDGCIDDRFTNQIVVFESKNAPYEFIKAIHKEYNYSKKVMKKHFNKNLIISEEEEHLFQQSHSSWICKKLIDNHDEKVKDYCHATGKFRGAAHWSCNINLQLLRRFIKYFII